MGFIPFEKVLLLSFYGPSFGLKAGALVQWNWIPGKESLNNESFGSSGKEFSVPGKESFDNESFGSSGKEFSVLGKESFDNESFGYSGNRISPS